MAPLFALLSSCVTIKERLLEPLGVTCEEFAVSKTYLQELRAACPKLEMEHIGAKQIFPLLMYQNYSTPTVKHHCAKTAVAAARRDCSNKVKPDPLILAKYVRFFKEVFKPRYVKFWNEKPRVISIVNWLMKFNQAYRDKIAFSIHKDNIRYDPQSRYKAFPKIEFQYTEVPASIKETPANKVKERLICGPLEQDKIYNAIIEMFEEVAHERYPEYCGRKDWPAICKLLDTIDSNTFGLWAEADGSGFDMTQLAVFNELMNELMLECVSSPVTELPEELSIDGFKRILNQALLKRVQMDNRNILYKTEGRASGDGWTTFANTMLMLSYYEFLEQEAAVKIQKVCKGDNILLHVNSKDVKIVVQKHKELFTQTKEKQEYGLGQVCDPLKFGVIEDCTFLSNHIFRTVDERLRMARIPARVLQTISWTTKMPGQMNSYKIRQELCYSKGMCLLAWARDLPIWRVLGKKMVELGRKGPHSEYDRYADEPRRWYKTDDNEAYLHYLQQRFGLSSKSVCKIEAAIQNITTLGGFVDIPELRVLMPV